MVGPEGPGKEQFVVLDSGGKKSPDELEPTLRKAFELDTSCVVEIPIDYRENARFSERIGDIRRVEEGVA